MNHSNCVNYDIKRASGAWAARAGRYSTLVPVTGHSCDTSSDVMVATHNLIRHRRRRIMELAETGIEDTISERRPKDLTYLLNCPPSGVLTNRTTRSCRRRHFCPFCWDREIVRDVYTRLEWYWYEGRRGSPRSCQLLEICGRRQAEIASLNQYQEFPAAESPYLLTVFSDRAFTKSGMIAIRTVEPNETNPSKIIISDRFAVVVRADTPALEWLDWPGHEIKIRRHTTVDREALAFAAARVCRYPLGMMIGSANAAALILKHRASIKHRWYRTYAQLRNDKARREAQLLGAMYD